MIHSSFFEPRIYPHNGATVVPAEIDRLQELSGTATLNREKINEIGRDGIVGWKVGIPEISLTLRQLEYGNFELFQKICNKTAATTSVNQNDFKTPIFDIAGFKTDDDGTFLGTLWYPNLRTNGFGINIGDPDALIERNFSFVGEDEIAWTDNNKYVIYLSDATATAANHQIVLGSGGFADYPSPVADPDLSGSNYFIRIIQIRSGVSTTLVEGTGFTFSTSIDTITFPNSQSGDTYKIWYTASSYSSGSEADPFVENDTDAAGLVADTCTILLQTSNTLSRLQSVGVDVTFDRQDLKEIGTTDVVQRGIRDKTVRITLGRIIESYSLEQLLRGAAANYGKYDARKYQDNINLIIKVYSDNNKGTFKMGYKFTNLAAVTLEAGVPTKDYVTRGNTLEGEELLVTNNEGDL